MTQPPASDHDAADLAALDFPTPCAGPECPQTATTQAFCADCNHPMTAAVCAGHQARVIGELAFHTLFGHQFRCRECGRIGAPTDINWRQL